MRKFFPADHVTNPRPATNTPMPQGAGIGVTPSLPSVGTGFGATVGAATAATGAAIAHAGTAARNTIGQVKEQIPVVKAPVQHIPAPVVTPPAIPKPQIAIQTPTPAVPTPSAAPSEFLTERRDVVGGKSLDTKSVLASTAASDDLTKIKGLGSILALKLNRIGITRLDQVAAWSGADILKINQQLEFSGRIEREDWIGQAKRLLAGKEAVVDGTTAHVTNQQKRATILSGQNAVLDPATSCLALRTVTGPADDLKRIAGVGVVLESKLNEMGYTHFEHIEHLSAFDIQRISEGLEFTGRIEREDWMGQAKRLSQTRF